MLGHSPREAMRFRPLILILLLMIPIGTVAVAQEMGAPGDWSPIGNGIEFQQFQLTNPAPVNVFVARMSRDNPNVTIDSSIAQGRLTGGAETVSGMASRYDQALNYWGPPTIPVSQTWGSRSNVVVAINGFYYGPPWEEPGVPWSGQIHAGWLAKRFSELESLSGFVWKMDRTAFIGECITHPANTQAVYITDGDTEYVYYIDGLNVSRDENELVLYTPQYDSDTGTDSQGLEVLVEMYEPSSVSVYAGAPKGIIRQVYDKQGSTPIPFDHVVLSAHGTAATGLLSHAKVGNTLKIGQRIKNCINPSDPDWSFAYAGVGGQFYFLRDGTIFDYSGDPQATVRDPRTAIAYNHESVFFIVADGRNPGISEGMTVAEMADFARNTLGATDGIMQDGGGSSTMVVNGLVVNNTFCNNVYCEDIIYLPLVSNTKSINTISPQQIQQDQTLLSWDSEQQVFQRLVANGMMMVEVESMEKSMQPLDPGDPITTLGIIDVYLGPGTNYPIMDKSSGDGTILSSLNDLGGVLAKENYWWKIKIGQIEGWVPESEIVQQLKFRSSYEFKTR